MVQQAVPTQLGTAGMDTSHAHTHRTAHTRNAVSDAKRHFMQDFTGESLSHEQRLRALEAPLCT